MSKFCVHLTLKCLYNGIILHYSITEFEAFEKKEKKHAKNILLYRQISSNCCIIMIHLLKKLLIAFLHSVLFKKYHKFCNQVLLLHHLTQQRVNLLLFKQNLFSLVNKYVFKKYYGLL